MIKKAFITDKSGQRKSCKEQKNKVNRNLDKFAFKAR